MTRMCRRGCITVRRHMPTCARKDELEEGLRCHGCLPVPSADGAVLCVKCLGRIRSHLRDAPDLCALLRSMVDPLGAQTYEPSYGTPAAFAPAPVRADLIDAGNDIIKMLIWWANYYGDETAYAGFREGFPAGTRPQDAHTITKWAADYLLNNLDRVIKNDAWVVMMSRVILDWPDDWGDWTIHKALSRFPLYVSAHWAKMPCPKCGVRTVRVMPSRTSADVAYECQSCHWVPPEDEKASWGDYLEAVVW